jgi:AcrR family transcriptional regulator
MFSYRVATPDRTGGREPHQLPPGRHGLSRSFVAENQRERILAAVADVTSAASYGEMTVEDVIGVAGISRRTFYEHFKNKEEAFLAAYDAVVEQLFRSVVEALERETTFAARVSAGLGAFLDFLAREPAFASEHSGTPAFARMCLVEVMAAGPDAVARRNGAMAGFGNLIQENAVALLEPPLPPGLIAETLVGGVYEVVYSRVLRGEIRALPELLPDLTYSMLLPYVGAEAALAERRRLENGAPATP